MRKTRLSMQMRFEQESFFLPFLFSLFLLFFLLSRGTRGRVRGRKRAYDTLRRTSTCLSANQRPETVINFCLSQSESSRRKLICLSLLFRPQRQKFILPFLSHKNEARSAYIFESPRRFREKQDCTRCCIRQQPPFCQCFWARLSTNKSDYTEMSSRPIVNPCLQMANKAAAANLRGLGAFDG